MKKGRSVSEPSRRRLVLLAELLSRVEGRVTSAKLAALTNWGDALIRHDIASIGFGGGVSNGYDAAALRTAIFRALDVPLVDKTCCIVGLGRLGSALLDESIFAGSGWRVVAGFDSNVNRTEILRSTFPLYPASRLEAVVEAQKIGYAILATQNDAAQKFAERLARCGVRGIVNYTDAPLSLPEAVGVENVSPLTALRFLAAHEQ